MLEFQESGGASVLAESDELAIGAGDQAWRVELLLAQVSAERVGERLQE